MRALARTVYLDRIEAAEAARHGLIGHERARELGRVWLQEWFVTLLTSMAARLRRVGADVPTSIDEVLRHTEARASPVAQADRLLSEGRPDEALTLLELRFEPAIGVGVRMAQKWMVEAECHFAQGRFHQALDVARLSVEQCEQHRSTVVDLAGTADRGTRTRPDR
jgi:hypothetical protein